MIDALNLRDKTPSSAWPWHRLAPLAVLAVAWGALWATGGLRYFSLEHALASRQTLEAVIGAHFGYALLAYVAVYTTAVAMSVPGASLLTIAGGVLFGGLVGGAAAVLAATSGGVLFFLIARGSLGAFFRERSGPRVEAFREGFDRDAVSYMLFLRLTPVFPFLFVNLAAALVGVRLTTFAWTTFVGIMPASFAFAFAGAGAQSVIVAQVKAYEACLSGGAPICRLHLDPGQLATPELLFSLAGIGLLALLPAIARRFWRRGKMGWE